MAKFSVDEETRAVVADEHGDLEYHDALTVVVDECVNAIEEAIWNLVDDIVYIVGEDTLEPSDDKDDDED